MKDSGLRLSQVLLSFSHLGFSLSFFFILFLFFLPFFLFSLFLFFFIKWCHSQTLTPNEVQLGPWPWRNTCWKWTGKQHLASFKLPVGQPCPTVPPGSQPASFPAAILAIKQEKKKNTIAPSHTMILVIFKHSPFTSANGERFKWIPQAVFGAERRWLSFLGRSFKFQSCGLVLYIVGL